jgi:hypothetical protein
LAKIKEFLLMILNDNLNCQVSTIFMNLRSVHDSLAFNYTNIFPLSSIFFPQNTSTTNAAVEQHRLKCAPPNNVIEDGFKNTNACNTNMSEADKQLLQYRATITNLTESTRRLETQLKFNQTLQTISIGLFLLMSIVIIYILKSEIKSSASEYCMNNN